MSDLSRREFLNQAAGAVTVAALSNGLASAASSENNLTVALIGCGGMGSNHLKLLAARKDARIAYLCDADADRLAGAVKTVESAGQPAPRPVKDMRTIFDDKSIDAVWIATPDHWHAPAAILACAAGKHVYVEKPCSHNVREGRLMLDAARKHNRVMQVGTQSRSTAHVQRAVQLLRDGAIGDVLVAKAWNSQLRGNIGHKQPSQPPAQLDYDLWVGPAPMRPYQSNLLPGIWRWWYEFGVGDIGNDGVHDIDIARWGLGVDTHPSSVAALGSKFFFDDDQQFADTMYCVYEYPGDGRVGHKRQLIFEQRDWSPYFQEGYENGNAFYGTKGMLILGKGGGFQVFGPRNKLIDKGEGSPDLPAHHQNFIDCIRSGNRPNADIAEGHLSAVLAHLGNIACRVGRTLHFDPATERIGDDTEADALVKRNYRDGHWAVPVGA
jgi:predicted dehydrogenase